jgi:hypothetical protein
MIAQLQRIVVWIDTVEVQLLGKNHGVLYLFWIRHIYSRRLIYRNGRQDGIGLRTDGSPITKPFLDYVSGFIR